jgi:hypothetical protein
MSDIEDQSPNAASEETARQQRCALEEPLLGGRTTIGVVKVGETVRRPATPNSIFVQSLLLHLERLGFERAPRYLGTDENARDVFSHVPGEVPAELGDHKDDVLEAAARLIRGFHDATSPMVHSDAAASAGPEVICHNDLSPCNTVFRAGVPVVLIDFDAACPGTRAFDLGYAAWLWMDWGNREWSAADQFRRLRLFLSAYEPGPTESEVIESAIRRQKIVMAAGDRTGNADMARWASDCRRWTLGHMQ